MNRAELIGRLTRDPELRTTPEGNSVATFSVATNHYAKIRGERQEVTDFHNIICWNGTTRKLADQVSQRLRKGSLVFVEGRLQTRSYDGADGVRRWSTEIVASDVLFLEKSRLDEEAFAL